MGQRLATHLSPHARPAARNDAHPVIAAPADRQPPSPRHAVCKCAVDEVGLGRERPS